MTAPALIRRIARRCLELGVVLLCAGTPPAFGAALQDPKDAKSPQEKPSDVTDIDLDELMKVHVTTAGRKEQSLTDVPSAIYVLREEDLKRSGATSIPEALRAVPGLQVARPRANSWAVSS